MKNREREAPATQPVQAGFGRHERRSLRKFAAVALLVSAGAALASLAGAGPKPADLPTESPSGDSGVHEIDDGGYRYVYEAVFDVESLFELESDPSCTRNLASARKDELRRLRAILLRTTNSATLEDLRRPHLDTIERLRGLGYL